MRLTMVLTRPAKYREFYVVYRTGIVPALIVMNGEEWKLVGDNAHRKELLPLLSGEKVKELTRQASRMGYAYDDREGILVDYGGVLQDKEILQVHMVLYESFERLYVVVYVDGSMHIVATSGIGDEVIEREVEGFVVESVGRHERN